MRATAGIAGSTEPEAAGTFLVGEVGLALWYASFGQHPRVDIWQVNAFGLQVEEFQDEWLCREVIPLARLTLLESGVTPEQAKRRLPGATDQGGLTGDIEVVFKKPKAEVVTTKVIRLSERLAYWMEAHPKWRPNPEWPEQVCSVLYSTPDALLLIDPLIRSDLDKSAWEWLDGIVASTSSPVVVLLTAPWHERSTREVADRYAAEVWAHPSARERLSGLANLDAIPEGIEIVTLGGVDEGQVAFLIEAERTLVVAEFFLGTATGLRILPSAATVDMAAFVQSLRELEELPIERVLVAHGPSVLAGGRSAIKVALRSFMASAPQKL
jgi:glyoxylase-like metal-dependent hydrolase (beta-lactamase superfamily II)